MVFWQNESRATTSFGVCSFVANKFVSIGCHKGDFRASELTKNTAHDRAEVVVTSGKKCFVDGFRQDRTRKFDGAFVGEFGNFRKFFAVETNHSRFSVVVGDFYLEIAGVDFESARLVW